MREARELVSSLCEHPDLWLARGLPSETELGVIASEIALALDRRAAAERERCTKIVESYVGEESYVGDASLADRIAAAIRSQP